jgi:flagellum-specific ATP synthase
MFNKSLLKERLQNTASIGKSGRITQVVGLVIESEGPKAPIGEICILKDKNGEEVTRTEIVGFKENNKILSMVLGNTENISPGMEIFATGHQLSVGVGDDLLGRVIDGLGEPLDNFGPIRT